VKRAVITVIFCSVLAAFGGCSSGTMGYRCYDEHDGECFGPPDHANDPCSKPSDCPASYTCSKAGRCLPGDCFFNECVTGFECQSSTGTWECLPSSGGAAGASGDDETSEAGAGGAL